MALTYQGLFHFIVQQNGCSTNLYQSSEGYLLYSKGNGCPKDITSGGCYLIGNKDLDPEISV
ncbi:hypothetical protein, partial [Escherichia coli]